MQCFYLSVGFHLRCRGVFKGLPTVHLFVLDSRLLGNVIVLIGLVMVAVTTLANYKQEMLFYILQIEYFLWVSDKTCTLKSSLGEKSGVCFYLSLTFCRLNIN